MAASICWKRRASAHIFEFGSLEFRWIECFDLRFDFGFTLGRVRFVDHGYFLSDQCVQGKVSAFHTSSQPVYFCRIL